MNSYPSIKLEFQRPECKPDYQKVSWQPTWNCFCCQDTGLVNPRAVERVCPDFDWERHKRPKCYRCNILSDNLEYQYSHRFTASLCEQLDSEDRLMWKEWAMQQHKHRQKAAKILASAGVGQSLRMRDRTEAEQADVEARHFAVTSN